jgi:hypothetical protein
LASGTTRPEWLSEEALASTVEDNVLSTLLARRTVFDRVGLFNESYPYAHDLEWFTRAQDRSVPYDIVEAILVRCRLHQTNLLNHNYPARQQEMLRCRADSIKRRRHESKYRA